MNEAWKGRKFKTDKYIKYEKVILLMLPKMVVPKSPLKLNVIFGMSSMSDLDNPLKPLIDILQKKYKFNDRDIMELQVKKTVVKKGKEFIDFVLSGI